MLVLLETKMADQMKLTEDLQYDMHIKFPSLGHSGGIIIMWKENILQVDELSVTLQGIHAIVKIFTQARRLVVHKGNRVSFINDSWIPNHPSIMSMIERLLTQADLSTTIATIYNNGVWDTSPISLNIPPNIIN
ncbi:hypothetical protein A4A49_64000, partial [Nicotiana attenuata]